MKNTLFTTLLFKSVLALTLLLTIQVVSHAQDTEQSEALSSVEQLSFMQGTWKGSGWIMKGRERKTFVQNEIINPRVENTILVVDGIGYDKDESSPDRKVIHNAFGVISFNEDMNAMTMLAFSTAGKKMENELKLIGDKKLEWSFKDERGGTIKFSEDFSKEGLWVENGHYSADGTNWFSFFQMTLERAED